MAGQVKIAVERFAIELEHKRFRAALPPDTGAVVSFSGIVRGDDDLSALRLDHYPGFTESEIHNIVDKACARWGLIDCAVVHRVGELEPEEVIVWVAAASKHRRDAFAAADYIMDYLKSDAPFWKQERRGDCLEWIEPRAQDYDDKKRWA